MSSHLRANKECQNCGYTVEMAYCPKCGQKNTETRQPFHHLFTHFIEDLTHYDGAFWKTIKHLLFRPGRLTREYLEGKRQTYVPPVKLYIFISFITFFILTIMATTGKTDSTPILESQAPSFEMNGRTIHSVKELEEYKNSPAGNEMSYAEYVLTKSTIQLQDHKVSRTQFAKTFFSTIPKVLFIYMPLFAFWLWLFHGKKRWYFLTTAFLLCIIFPSCCSAYSLQSYPK